MPTPAWIEQLAAEITPENARDKARLIRDRYPNIFSRQKMLSMVKVEFENTHLPDPDNENDFRNQALNFAHSDLDDVRGFDELRIIILKFVLADFDYAGVHYERTPKDVREFMNLYWKAKKGNTRIQTRFDPSLIERLGELPDPYPFLKYFTLQDDEHEVNDIVNRRGIKKRRIEEQHGGGNQSDSETAAFQVNSEEEAKRLTHWAESELEKDVYSSEDIIPLMLLTGRRLADFCPSVSKFVKYPGSDNKIIMSGGSKRKGDLETISFPILGNMQVIWPAIGAIQNALKAIEATMEDPKPHEIAAKFRTMFDKQLANYVEQHKTVFAAHTDTSQITPHMFRKVYAACVPFLVAHTGNSADFVRKCLGHTSLLATQHYLGNTGPKKVTM